MKNNIKYKIQFEEVQEDCSWTDYICINGTAKFQTAAEALEEVQREMGQDFLDGDSGKWVYRIVPFVTEQ